MEENIMNEEVMETTTEGIVEAASKEGFKKTAVFGLGMIAGVVAYKYVLKPVGAKIKNWNEKRKAKSLVVGDTEYDVEDDFDDKE